MSTNQDDRGPVASNQDVELRALFEPRRPAAARFRAGVAERLRHATDRTGDAGVSGAVGAPGAGAVPVQPVRGSWCERAAAMLPALPPGTSLASTVGAWLSLPALLFVGSVAAFWRGDRSLVGALRSARSGLPRRVPSGVQGTFWRRHATWLLAGGVGAVFAALGCVVGRAAIEDVLLVVLLGSMLVLVGQIGALAAHDGAPADAVGACVFDLLAAAVFGLLVWGLLGGADATAGGALGAAGLVLVFGGLVVEVLRRWRTREFGLAIFWGVVVAALAALCVLRAFAPAGSAALRHELAHATPAGADAPHWRALELCGAALRAGGEPVPDLKALRQHLSEVIAAQPGPWPVTWSAGERLGLISKEQWSDLARTDYVAGRLPRLLADGGGMALFAHDRFLLDALLGTRDLGDGERAHLLARIERSWPVADAPNPGVDVGIAWLCVQWLDRLGRADLVTARVAMLHELLRSHWVAPAAANRDAEGGGFAARRGDRASLPATIEALELLLRVGPPPEIDVPSLRAFLRRHADRAPMASLDGWGKQACAGLGLLDAVLPVPPRSAGAWLVDERLLIGSLLLVALALRAMWFTRPLGGRGRGAMP